MKLAANAPARTPKLTKKSTPPPPDSGTVPIEPAPPLSRWWQRPDERSKHAFEAQTDAVQARAFVNTALDDMDRLVGTIIGIIDDIDYEPSDADRARVRKAAAMMRANLTAATCALSQAIDQDLGAGEANWQGRVERGWKGRTE